MKLISKRNKRNSIRAQKLVRLISDNLGNTEGGKTMYEMMIEAGYSESTARQQTNILAGLKPKLRPLIEALERERETALKLLASKIEKAPYRDLVGAIDRFTKTVELLTGNPTERANIHTEVSDEQYRRIVEAAYKRLRTEEEMI